MINGLEGIPGSGKSYEAVVYHVLEALKRGRRVVTNLPLIVPMFAAIDSAYADLIELRSRPLPVRGTWDANRVDDKGNGQAFVIEEGRADAAPESVPVFGHVWDYYHEWRHAQSGLGPLFVIDECHLALPVMGTDVQVLQWYKLHRHFNVDVLLMTQSFRDINQPIARLMAMMIRCRKADFLGDGDSYIRKVHAGYRGALVSSEKRKYLPQFFPLYRSHTQGQSVVEVGASDVTPFIVKWRRLTVAWFAMGIVGGIAWWSWPKEKLKPKPAPFVASAAAVQAARAPVAAASAPAKQAVAAEAEAKGEPEALGDKRLHVKGRITMGQREMWFFVVSQNGQVVESMTDAELRAAGYQWRPSGDCTGYVQWKQERPRAVSCDMPSVQVANMPKG